MTHHVLQQLPLWVGGDLDAERLAAVEHHLTQCPGCASAAGDLRASQHLLREATTSPFDASDQERLRRQLMARVRAEATARPARRVLPWASLLAASAASLLLAALWWRQAPATAVPKPTPGPGAVPLLMPPPQAMATRQNPAPTRTRGPSALARETLPPSVPARIEFQTADPTIRIIWLAQKQSLAETSPPTEETS